MWHAVRMCRVLLLQMHRVLPWQMPQESTLWCQPLCMNCLGCVTSACAALLPSAQLAALMCAAVRCSVSSKDIQDMFMLLAYQGRQCCCMHANGPCLATVHTSGMCGTHSHTVLLCRDTSQHTRSQLSLLHTHDTHDHIHKRTLVAMVQHSAGALAAPSRCTHTHRAEPHTHIHTQPHRERWLPTLLRCSQDMHAAGSMDAAPTGACPCNLKVMPAPHKVGALQAAAGQANTPRGTLRHTPQQQGL
jgi:hypothetical protein